MMSGVSWIAEGSCETVAPLLVDTNFGENLRSATGRSIVTFSSTKSKLPKKLTVDFRPRGDGLLACSFDYHLEFVKAF